jgi:hypothetical protein
MKGSVVAEHAQARVKEDTMHLVARFGIFVAALAGSLLGVLAIFPLGLVASEFVVYPLAAAIGGLFAALAAGWAGTLLAADRSRTRLLQAVGAAEVTAAVVAALLLAYLVLAGRLLPRVLAVAPILLAVACAMVLAAGATAAAWRYRTADRRLAGDVRLTIAVLVLAVAGVPAVLFVASLFDLTGA